MSARKRALGRGLDSLLGVAPQAPDAPAHAPASAREVAEIALDEIQPNPNQPRREFDDQAIAELSDSIREKGVLQPLLVRRNHGAYELIAGERRYRAAQRAGLDVVPCLVVEVSDTESFEIALVENLQREDLNPMEEARAYRVLIEEFGLSQEDTARRVGKSRPAVANSLRLMQLPADVQDDLMEGRLSAGHARAILALDSAPKQRRLRNLIVGRGLSVRQAEAEAKRLNEGPRKKEPKTHGDLDAQLRVLQDAFRAQLGLMVDIKPTGAKSGRVVIRYKSLDDFEAITQFFRIDT